MRLFRLHQLDYNRGLMTVTFSSVVNLANVTLSDVFESSAGRPVQKQGFMMLIVDGRHCRKASLTLQDDDGPQWTRQGIRVRLRYRRDGRNITTAEKIKIRRVANKTTAIVRWYLVH